MTNQTETIEICICDRCEGSGKARVRTSAYDSEIQECSPCSGSGRVKKIITYLPYIIDKK